MKCSRRKIAAGLSKVVLFGATLGFAAGCVSEVEDLDVGGVLLGDQDEREPARGDGAARPIEDGTSNTQLVGENDANRPDQRGPRDRTAPDPNQVVSPERPGDLDDDADDAVDDTPDDSADEPPTGGDPGDPQGVAAEITAQLADRLFEFGTADFFSSGSITENSELQLCAFGRFGMRVTTITSTSFDTFSSEDLLFGTWSIELRGASAVLVLNVDDADDQANLGRRELTVEFDPQGAVFIDNQQTQVFDVSADCAAAAP